MKVGISVEGDSKKYQVGLGNVEKALDALERRKQKQGIAPRMEIVDIPEKQKKPLTTITPDFAGANPHQTSTINFDDKGEVVSHRVTLIR